MSNIIYLDHYLPNPQALEAAMRRHPCNRKRPLRLTRRGRIVANIAACIAVLAICTVMGLAGYLEGL
jgi:hypothetical protein